MVCVPSETLMCESLVRRQLRDGDVDGIVDLHDRVYRAEYGVDARFVAAVAAGIEAALGRGWPACAGAVWLVDLDGHAGVSAALALTDEGGGVGRVRWFVLAAELRGRGLGRSMLAELLAEGRATGMRRLELETFSALRTAAHLYRTAGFRLLWEQPTDKWGPAIVYQGYELMV